MAGGRGQRFWPKSRLARPKHLLPIVGKKSMLAQTLDRVAGLVEPENVLIITNREQREAVLELGLEISPEQVIGEPVGRDTAAVVGLATTLVKGHDPEAAFALLPADAVVNPTDRFREDLELCFMVAEGEEALVTLGARPSRAATGYGYLHRGAHSRFVGRREVYAVRRFVEKPDAERAAAYLASGEYYWNIGVFVWRVSTIEAALGRYAPTLWEAFRKMGDRLRSGESLEAVLSASYPAVERKSFDYAVLEKAENILTIEASFDWDDVGEWSTIARHFDGDAAGNVLKGSAVVMDGSGNIVVGEEGHLTALLGVDDLVVVQTRDATLVARKSKLKGMKALLETISDDPDLAHLC